MFKVKKNEPTRKQIKELNSKTRNILKSKDLLESLCAGYDSYIKDNNLNINYIKNPFNANRLNEWMQAHSWRLTLGGIGAGNDTLEGYELKLSEYPGLNKKTNELKNTEFNFNGTSKMNTWKEQEAYLFDYISRIKGLKITLRCPDGDYLHFESKMNLATKDILLEDGKKHFESLEVYKKDPRMKIKITLHDLLAINNLKLKKGTNKEIAKKYLGATYKKVL